MSENFMDENPQEKRKKILIGFASLLIGLGSAFGVYWYVYASKFVSTDNAYTAVEIAQVTPSTGGTISQILVNDTDSVKVGDVLVTIDQVDIKNIMEQAQANLDSTIRRVQGYMANDGNLNAQITAREADKKRIEAQISAAIADFEKASIDLKRREALIASGSVSEDELTRTKNAYVMAKSNLEAMQAMLQQAQANLDATRFAKKINDALIYNTTEETHPEIIAARAKLEQAKIDYERTLVRSPIDGIISKRQVQLGQRIQQGTYLLSVVPLEKMHVDANFKEVQLEKVKVGQKATLYADIYGKHTIYHGVVEGFSGGTGAAFAAIPAQNATGNWIKVVQRLPIRIKLDEDELNTNPLRVGLSMNVEIDTSTSKN